MNYLFYIIFISTSFIFTTQDVFAYKSLTNCPDKTTIATYAKFIRAALFESKDGDNVWDLISQNFDEHEKEWNILFRVRLPHVKTEKQALASGQNYYNHNVILMTPVSENCVYDLIEDSYVVRAYSPPFILIK